MAILPIILILTLSLSLQSIHFSRQNMAVVLGLCIVVELS